MKSLISTNGYSIPNIELPDIEEIYSRIGNAFNKVEEVIAIYALRYPHELKITILINNKRYNDELLDRLLDIEYGLQSEDADLWLSFSYIPKIYDNKDDIIHPKSLLIFS